MNIFKQVKERGELNSWYKDKIIENDKKLIVDGIRDIKDIEPIGSINNIPVIQSSAIIASTSAFIAMISLQRDGSYIIIVDDLFNKLSEDARRCILAHELGHYELKHLENIDRSKNKIINDISKEYEADEYAAKLFGYVNMCCALDELVELINKMLARGILSSINLAYVKSCIMKRKLHLMK